MMMMNRMIKACIRIMVVKIGGSSLGEKVPVRLSDSINLRM